MIFHKTLNKWLPPGGHIEWGEDPFQAVQREVHEEIGITNVQYYLPTPISLSSEESRVHLIPPPVFILNENIPNHGEHIDLIYFGQTTQHPTTPENHRLRFITQDEIPVLDTFPNVVLMSKMAFQLLH